MKKKLLIFILLLAFAKAVTAQPYTELDSPLQRVEPPFWWAGMDHSQVQLMLYGQEIGSIYQVDSDDVQIVETKTTDNSNYLLVTIETKDLAPGKITLRLNSIETTKVLEYEIKKRKSGSAARKGFDSSDVIYLVMPDRFANGDPSNDNTADTKEKSDRSKKGGRHGGDLQGIIDHLDYIDDLGATALWSTPVQEDNEATYSYHGYAISDLYRIDPRYGTNADYRRLADELHQRDMKLIMDMVPNHWGASHWMMRDLPMPDWIHYFNDNDGEELPLAGFARSNYRQSTQFDPYQTKIDEVYAQRGWFDYTMPDMNTSNPTFITYMIQNAIWWIEYAGLDGIRVDTYPYNEKEGIARWTKAIMDEYPNFNVLGETWLYESAHVAFWQKDSPIAAIQNYNSHLPTVMDKPLNVNMLKAFKEEAISWDKGLVHIYNSLTNDFMFADPNQIVILAGNHDTNRINGSGVFKGNLEKYKLAMTFLLTTRGIPQIYYGDEIGMGGNRDTDGDGDIRRDFPGGWAGDKQNAFRDPTDEQKAYQDFTRKLLNYRKQSTAIHNGKLLHYVPENNCYVYFRYNEQERVMVIINNSTQTRTLDLNRFAEGLDNRNSGVDVLTDRKVGLKDSIKISAQTSMVIDLMK
ncbi:MAG: glycoside hydrolase family 13 protein [Nonlabens sp.]